MTVIKSLLADSIDYAGLFPPSKVDMRSAVDNYRAYRQSPNAELLGRFVVGIERLDEFQNVCGATAPDVPLTIVAPKGTDWDSLQAALEMPLNVASLEVAVETVSDIDDLVAGTKTAGNRIQMFCEIPWNAAPALLDALTGTDARAKLRMGGLVHSAFPSSEQLATTLHALSKKGLAFKATAGLHHPIRSSHPYTYEQNSLTGLMHGFMNLYLASTLLYFAGDVVEATALLDEQDPSNFRVKGSGLGWRQHEWNVEEVREARRSFAGSFGSCSFNEPVDDLRLLGWL